MVKHGAKTVLESDTRAIWGEMREMISSENDIKIPESARPWGDFTLMLLPKEELLALPNGTIVIDIFGKPCEKSDKIDTETRGGMTAFGFLKSKDD